MMSCRFNEYPRFEIITKNANIGNFQISINEDSRSRQIRNKQFIGAYLVPRHAAGIVRHLLLELH
jgi:hypothetical protein